MRAKEKRMGCVMKSVFLFFLASKKHWIESSQEVSLQPQ